jgi:hypothetical protein
MRAVIAAAVAVIAVARPVAAEPSGSRVLTAPAAWLPQAGGLEAMLGIDHRGDGAAVVGLGLGGLAEVELGADSDIRGCAGCGSGGVWRPLHLARAGFRIGARQDAWLGGMPAIAFGVRAQFAAYEPPIGDPQVADAYLVASRDLGVVRLHAGADALAAGVAGKRAALRLRPIGAIEIHPPMYPRSSLLGDIAWLPELDAVRGPQLGWLLGIGVRYQAFSWASIELAVRARQGEELGRSTVMVRLNAIARP